jgi:putative permease
MLSFVQNWFSRHFSDPQVVGLAIVLVVGFLLVYATGDMLAPVLAALVIAYLLEGLVVVLQRQHVPRIIGVVVVFSLFLAVLLFVLFGILPLLSSQATQFMNRLPDMLARAQDLMLTLPERYPGLVSVEQAQQIANAARQELLDHAQQAVTLSLSSVVGVLTILVYLVLLPLLVFFFLKDKTRILDWVKSFLPQERDLVWEVWFDVDAQIGNYVRGKFIEILIVGIATYVVFLFMNLQFALLLGVLVGLSVLIPYVGATVVTLPVAAVAYLQFGHSADFAWVIGAYLVIQALDGNVLVPLLFSEVVNLHPIAIIVAILIFGGLWGFWGVFFAIPLATLVHAVLKAWPTFDSERGHRLPERDAA